METIIISILFVLGYTAIAFEHTLKLNKAASALLTGILCWTVLIISHADKAGTTVELSEHFSEIASILFFLLGAMTIVELIDTHNGFEIIIGWLRVNSKRKLLLYITIITFFLSAVLDNLTTAIVMVSILPKLLAEKEDRWWFAGMVIIAANSGGAWSPLGDVTTTMLWMGGQVTAMNIILKTFIPSIAACVIPAILIGMKFRGQRLNIVPAPMSVSKESNLILFTGIGLLLFVPVFKTVTGLPPFMGMLLALAVIWIITTIIHSGKDENAKLKFTVTHALQRIDSPSILFFLGILLAVSAMESSGILHRLAEVLTTTLNNDHLIASSLGVLSALVDNVPLVAAAQGMFGMDQYPTDHSFWELLALTTGTGGSMIIIGSAAGVAIMGIEKISFGWYLRKIGWIAMIGFVTGVLTYILQEKLLS